MCSVQFSARAIKDTSANKYLFIEERTGVKNKQCEQAVLRNASSRDFSPQSEVQGSLRRSIQILRTYTNENYTRLSLVYKEQARRTHTHTLRTIDAFTTSMDKRVNVRAARILNRENEREREREKATLLFLSLVSPLLPLTGRGDFFSPSSEKKRHRRYSPGQGELLPINPARWLTEFQWNRIDRQVERDFSFIIDIGEGLLFNLLKLERKSIIINLGDITCLNNFFSI